MATVTAMVRVIVVADADPTDGTDANAVSTDRERER